MKISGSDSNFFKKKIEDSKKAERPSTSSSSESKESGTSKPVTEKIAVSDLGREIAKIHEQVKNTPDVRVEKVQELKRKIEDGSYYVSSDKIAGKIVDDMLKEGQ